MAYSDCDLQPLPASPALAKRLGVAPGVPVLLMDELTRARIRHDTGMVVDLITEAVDLLLKAAGSSSFMENNKLSRIYCDLGTGGSHVHATPGIAADNYGKLLLGSSTPIPAHV